MSKKPSKETMVRDITERILKKEEPRPITFEDVFMKLESQRLLAQEHFYINTKGYLTHSNFSDTKVYCQVDWIWKKPLSEQSEELVTFLYGKIF